jgi:hypothetical protein
MKRATIWSVIIILAFITADCGRTSSRYLGKDHKQVLEVENMKEFVSISFDKNGNSTVKDVTFIASDGYVYTREFKDASPFQGVIRWVPHDHSESFIQSRALSRWGGGAVNLRLEDDCTKVLGVDVGYASKGERVKNLTYLNKEGKILSKEYREGLIDRHLEGWLEVKSKIN